MSRGLRAPRRLALAGAVLAGVALTAACSSAGPAPGRSGRPSAGIPQSSSAPAPVSSSPVPSSSAPPTVVTTLPPVTVTTAPSSPAPGVPGTPAPRSTCTSLTVRVLRGSAAPGYEFAALQFVNSGTARCVLYGYPAVTLLRGGAVIGTPSAPGGTVDSRFVLDPGAVAESRLQDYSSCQAPLSDEVRVTAPGSSITVTRPGQLRACSLRVSALATPE